MSEKWVLAPTELTIDMLHAVHDAYVDKDDVYGIAIAAIPPIPDSVLAEMVERGARAIDEVLEGPVNNQDFGRQLRQWELAKQLASACLRAALGIDRAAADEGERHG